MQHGIPPHPPFKRNQEARRKEGQNAKKKKNIYEKAFNTGSLKIYRYLDLGTRRVNE
jgi:hypothetical protein